jgi:hypothetical protein
MTPTDHQPTPGFAGLSGTSAAQVTNREPSHRAMHREVKAAAFHRTKNLLQLTIKGMAGFRGPMSLTFAANLTRMNSALIRHVKPAKTHVKNHLHAIDLAHFLDSQNANRQNKPFNRVEIT